MGRLHDGGWGDGFGGYMCSDAEGSSYYYGNGFVVLHSIFVAFKLLVTKVFPLAFYHSSSRLSLASCSGRRFSVSGFFPSSMPTLAPLGRVG